MPGWHAATKTLREAGKVRMAGIVQEQHPARAKLFMQWKQMQWPVLVDAYNALGVQVVPITLLIDEHGVIRKLLRSPDELTEELLAPSPPPTAPANPVAPGATTIAALTDRVAEQPDDAAAHFRLGVAYRYRYDGDEREAEDFRNAVWHWTEALRLDPNNYIWRRRIQQYGPRLGKPYPFYDWVKRAREDIRSRGDTPVELPVEPRGAELAQRANNLEPAAPSVDPDPQGKITRDEGLVAAEVVAVPPAVFAGEGARVHVVLRPAAAAKAHWNNDVKDTMVWLEPPKGWAADRDSASAPRPKASLSTEARAVEFELAAPADAPSGRAWARGYALYYVCEDVSGTCLYRRQDLEVPIDVSTRKTEPR